LSRLLDEDEQPEEDEGDEKDEEVVLSEIHS
jgi:hypothetical protein